MKISHTPHSRRKRIGWQRLFHQLKSPASATWAALGAHTANATPSTPVNGAKVRAQLLPGAQVAAFAQQPHVRLAEPGPEPVRIFDDTLAVR